MTIATRLSVEALLAEQDWLHSLSHYLVRNEHDAEELYQETLLAGLQERADVRGALRPWLAQVLRNRLSRRRDRQELKTRAQKRAQVEAQTESPSADRVAQRFTAQRQVVEAVHRLGETYRDVVLLRFWEDMPPREIAAQLDLPVETVKTRLKRGMAKLRSELDEDFGGRQEWMGALTVCLHAWQIGARPATGLSVLSLAAMFVLGAAALVWYSSADTGSIPVVNSGSTANAARPVELESGRAPVVTAESASKASEPIQRQPISAQLQGRSQGAQAPATNSELRVLDDKTGKPVKGVRVYQVRKARPPPGLENELLWGVISLHEYVLKTCYEMSVDASGRVRFARAKGESQMFIACSSKGEGMLRITGSRGPGEFAIRMHPRVDVPVEVVDAAGKACPSVRLKWVTKNTGRNRFRTGAGVYTPVAAGHGMVHLFSLRARMAASKGFAATEHYLEVALPFAKPIRKRLDLSNLPMKNLRFVLPPTGSLEVTVMDARGKPSKRPVTIELFTPESFNKQLGGSRMSGPLLHAVTEKGVHCFGHIGLGQVFIVRAKLDGRADPIIDGIPALRTAGQHQDITLRTSVGSSLAFQVVDAAGKPLAGVTFAVSLRRVGKPAIENLVVVSDAEGRVEYELPRFYQSGEEGLMVLCARGPFARLDPSRIAAVKIPASPSPGAHRMGRVEVGEAPLLCSGVLKGEDGRPLSRMRLSFMYREANRRWLSIPDLHGFRTDADGRFVRRGYSLQPKLCPSLRMNSIEFRLYPRSGFDSFAPGSKGLRLVAGTTGRFEMSFKEPIEADGRELNLRLIPLSSEQSDGASYTPPILLGMATGGSNRFSASLQAERRYARKFRFPQVIPGRYELQIVFGYLTPATQEGLRASEILFRTGVRIKSGETTRPKALQNFDPSPYYQVLRIRIEDGEGRPRKGITVSRWSSLGRSIGFVTDADGVARVWSPLSGAQIALASRGLYTVPAEFDFDRLNSRFQSKKKMPDLVNADRSIVLRKR